MTRICMLDMDGVLTDFSAAACALFDHEPPGPEQRGKATHEVIGVTQGQFWSRIDGAGRAFWESMPATPFANDLVSLARDAGEVMVVTSPSLSPGSAAGKIRWLQTRFGRRFRDYAITARKETMAAPGRLLIDDTAKHVDAFTAAGGEGLLFPTWENGRRGPGDDPLDAVRSALASLEAHPRSS